jgi:site-specific DNA-methyltransferase (adenine-specific)
MSNQILHGDCFEIMPKIAGGSIDLIITDPPYSISRSSNFKKNPGNKKFDKISLDFGYWDSEIDLNILFYESNRILKKGGTIIIFYDIWKSLQIKDSAERWGFKQPRICQWVKNNAVPLNSKHNYLSNAIEYFFTFVKVGKPTFNSKYDNGIYNYPICHGKERTGHPTQKPVKLIESIILKHSNEGDLILDCFSGSGTTGEACINLNRNYFLIEKDINYYSLSINRLRNLKINNFL